MTHNQVVPGSSPGGPTSDLKAIVSFLAVAFFVVCTQCAHMEGNRGSADISGSMFNQDSDYPYFLASLNKKNLMSETPRNCLLNSLILHLMILLPHS